MFTNDTHYDGKWHSTCASHLYADTSMDTVKLHLLIHY